MRIKSLILAHPKDILILAASRVCMVEAVPDHITVDSLPQHGNQRH